MTATPRQCPGVQGKVFNWFLPSTKKDSLSPFLTGLSSLLGPLGFWCLALPVGVCCQECNNDNDDKYVVCSDRILTFGVRSIYSLAKVGIGCYKLLTVV